MNPHRLRSLAPRAPSHRRAALALAALLAAAAALSACSSCSERVVNPESAEDAARIWGELLCDMRESRVTLYINDFENQHGTAMVRAQLLGGDRDGKDRARFLGELNEFVEANGHALVDCQSEIQDTRTLDNGRVLVDLGVDYHEIGYDEDGDPELVEVHHDLTLETTEIDGFWRVTGEPAGAPALEDFRLLHPTRAHTVP